MARIPKIIHQLWIGPQPAPLSMMNTWKEKHPGYEYIFWNESEIQKRGLQFVCQSRIDLIDEWNGKADIMRWEILYHMGGYFIDADSICIEPFDSYFEGKTAFATFENETVRKGLVATGTMGFIPKHPLCRDILRWIASPDSLDSISRLKAWGSVGPGALTRFLNTGNYPDVSIYPSHCFLPIHFTGTLYVGHKKVYAYQAWGATNDSYSTMNDAELPPMLKEPKQWVSVLICSYNTCRVFLRECLDSIKAQNGVFGIEVVWINDGSDAEYTAALEEELTLFERRSRFCKVVYERTAENEGVASALNRGLDRCSYDLIFRMDSDDIMVPNRIKTQLEFMKQHPECVCCGSNMSVFTSVSASVNTNSKSTKKTIQTATEHPYCIRWERLCAVYKEHGGIPAWFMNHPTLCYRKSVVASLGKYDTSVGSLEDYDLELRILKKHGVVYNIQENLLMYRSHPGQVTRLSDVNNTDVEKLRAGILQRIFSDT